MVPSSNHHLPIPAFPGLRAVGDVLAASDSDGRWRQRLRQRLDKLQRAFAEHIALTEGPDGLYSELVTYAPRLARGAHLLIREHVSVAAALTDLRHQVDLPEVSAEELRIQAGTLSRELSRHRQRGADLLYQAYQTDLGGED